MAMKRIVITSLLFLAMTLMACPHAAAQSNIRYETIVRNDTVTRTDTIITTKKIKRTEIIQRSEEVFYSDSLSIIDGVRSDKTVTLSTEPSAVQMVPVPVIPSGSSVLVTPSGSPVSADTVAISVTPTPVETVEIKENIPAQLPPQAGGDYMWIPDSLRSDVRDLLSGYYVKKTEGEIGNQGEDFDPDERVTFRGDTINMVLRDRNLGRFNRGLFNYLFIPKGVWSIGVTASYGEFSTEDLEVLDLMSDIDFSGHIFSIRPYFSYFIGNNRAVGLRLGYSSGKANIGSFKVDIDEDMNFNLHDISYRSESYTAAITYNQYYGITRRGRFGIFNEVELAFSSGNSDFIRPYSGELKNTHTNTMQVALNFSPGVSIYIMDPVTFNISFGVFGVSLRNEKQTVDGVDMGSRFTSGANFRFNIFNINFGVAVNL